MKNTPSSPFSKINILLQQGTKPQQRTRTKRARVKRKIFLKYRTLPLLHRSNNSTHRPLLSFPNQITRTSRWLQKRRYPSLWSSRKHLSQTRSSVGETSANTTFPGVALRCSSQMNARINSWSLRRIARETQSQSAGWSSIFVMKS
jgi:hypothetical protein